MNDKNPPRKLTLAMATALVVGNMIGTGIFLLPATMAPFAGVSILAWVFTIGGAMLLALTFAWLARVRAVAGGIYAYTKLAFGDFTGFLVAWSYWIGLWITSAALATGAISYLSSLVPVLAQSNAVAMGAALGLLWLLIGVNLRGVRTAGGVQLVTSILKIAPLVLLMLMGLWYLEPAHFVPFNPTDKPLVPAMGAAAALALWAVLGLESAAVASGSVENPQRNIGRATLIGTALAAIVTAVICVGAMAIVPPAQLAQSNAPFADVAGIVWGGPGATIMSLTGTISAVGALNGWLLLSGQMPQAMARDGFFPEFAARENARGAPANGLVLGGVLSSILIVFSYSGPLVAIFSFLALLATLANLVPYLFCAMAALRLMQPGSAVPLTPWRIAALLGAFAYGMWMLYGAGQEVVFWGFLLLLSGLPVYVWMRRGAATA